MAQFSVEVVSEGAKKYYYIQDNELMEMVLLPSQYLAHKVKCNLSPNTVKRAAFALCYYMKYLKERQKEIETVYEMAYDEQSQHFISFLYWIKSGQHKEKNSGKGPDNGTCNAYLKDVFRFYCFIEMEYEQFGSLRVFSHTQHIMPNAAGVKRTIRTQSFKGYLKAEERRVRAATEDEIITAMQACTNCRDQLLLLLLAETGFRIGELLGVNYVRDVDYQNRTVRVWFRDDNENSARAKNAEYRKAKISQDAFEFLLHYLAEYRDLISRQSYLFINISGDTAGQPLQVGSVYDMLNRLEKKTGIALTPHMLRRYFASARWDAGWALELLSQALGHRHLDTTIKYLAAIDEKLMTASTEFYEKHSSLYGIEKLL